MILSLFGPDGVGKSTVATQLADSGWTVFSGTNIDTWPDQSWHRHFISKGIDENSIEHDEHFLEKIARVHAMARNLESWPKSSYRL